MFTPPPSPRPAETVKKPTAEFPFPSPDNQDCSPDASQAFHRSQEAKRRTSQRFRLAVLLVPLVLILITASASYSVHLNQAHAHTPSSWSWYALLSVTSKSPPQKRHPEPEPQGAQMNSPTDLHNVPTSSQVPVSSQVSASSQVPGSSQVSGSSQVPGSSLASGSSLAPSSSRTPQAVPTVPTSPATLPTPFPQPFDGTLAQNFSSISCLNFFSNMTNSLPFRSCRPFSLLLQSSTAFINAQSNLTLLNSMVWGTCNTNTGFDQCKANMGWFTDTLKTACADDLAAQSTMAVATLTGLQAYGLMHQVGCLEDPTTDTYCFLNAAQNSNPTDLYYYQLPLGLKVPRTATPSCSACSKSLMGAYAAALQDKSQASQLTALKATYGASAQFSVQFCGASFAVTSVASVASSLRYPMSTIFIAPLVWMMLASLS